MDTSILSSDTILPPDMDVSLSPPTTSTTIIKITRPKRKRKQPIESEEKSESLSTTAVTVPNKKRSKKISKPKDNDDSLTFSDDMCQVCCEKFGGNIRQCIKCPRCPYKACKSCHQWFLLNSIGTPHCMNCRNRWTYKDLLLLFKASFVNKTFRKQRGQYLLDRAKSHLPLAMPYAEVEKNLSKLDDELKPLLKEYMDLKRTINHGIYNAPNREESHRRYYELGGILAIKRAERYHLNNQSYRNRHRRRREDTYAVYEEPCPIDNCRGFVEKGSQKCGICQTFVCRKCTKPLGKLNSSNILPITKFIPSTQTKKEMDELEDILEEIDKYEKKNQSSSSSSSLIIDESLNDMEEKMDIEIEEKMDKLSSSSSSSSFSSNISSLSSSHTQTTTQNKQKSSALSTTSLPNEINDDDDEKLLSVTNLSEEEKKELRKLKKAHKCKQEDVDSVKEIRNCSRPCPNCKSRIFKIAGCDTMWCTRCNTGFNWRTGMIITDARDLHNPHYVDFIRNNPNFQYNRSRQGNNDEKKDEGKDIMIDNPCDRLTFENVQLPNSEIVNRKVSHLYNGLRDVITGFQQQMGHIRWFARRRFVNGNQYDEVEYALRYVTDKWDEKRWRIQVEHHDRFRQTNQEYIDVLMTWTVVMNDLFAKYLTHRHNQGGPNHKITNDEAKEFIEQMTHISNYTNTALKDMDKIYKRKTIVIDIPKISEGSVLSDMFTDVKNFIGGISL